MIIESIYLEGFLSYLEPQTIDLTGIHVGLVNGAINGDPMKSNGSGKSSLLEAPGVCFFGKTGGRTNILDRYINDFADKFKLEVIFTIDGKRWRATRINPRGKSGSFQLSFQTEDGKWKKSDRDIENVLGLSCPTYGSTIYLSERESLKFISGTSSERKEILRELLNIEVYEEASEYSSKQVNDINKRCSMSSVLIESKNKQIEEEGELEDIEILEKSVKKAKQLVVIKKKELAEKQEELKNIEINATKKINIEKSLSDEKARLSKSEEELAEYNKEVEKIIAEGKKCSTQIEAKKLEITNIEKQIKDIKDKLALPEPKAEVKEKPTDKLNEAREKIKSSREDIKNKRVEIKEAGDKVKEAKEKLVELSKSREEAVKYESEKDQIEKQLQKFKKFGSICPATEEPCSVITDEFKEKFEADKNKELEKATKKLDKINKEIADKEKAIKTEINEWGNKEDLLLTDETNLSVEETKWTREETKLIKEIADIEAKEKKDKLEAEEREKKKKVLQDDLSVKEGLVSPVKIELAKLEGSIEERRSAYKKAQVEVEKTEEVITGINAKIEAYEKELSEFTESDKDEINQAIEDINSEIELRESQIVELTKDIAITQEKKIRIDNLKADVEKLKSDLNELLDEKEIYTALVKIFGKDGIQKAVMKDAVPTLEDTANELLNIFTESDKIKIKFELDPKNADGELKANGGLEILVLEAGKEPKDLSMYSGGETVRIVFSIVLSLAKLLSKRSGKKQETLIIDEKISKLDISGIEQFADIIRIIAKWYKKVFIVTHINTLKDLLDSNSEIFVNKTSKGSHVEVRL